MFSLNIYIPSSLSLEQLQVLISALPKNLEDDVRFIANQMIAENTYTFPPFGVKKYQNTDVIPWEDEENSSRSFLRLMHGHIFLGYLTEAFRLTGDHIYIDKGLHLILDWIAHHSFEEKQNTMAFHDETTALRLQFWLKFYIFTRDKLAERDRMVLEETMQETAALLANEDFHSTNTNHGMFQDLALLLFALYFENTIQECHSYKDLAITRLKNYFMHIFTNEGVHKEHAPAYHFLVAMYVRDISKLITITTGYSQSFMEFYEKAEEYATYIIRPDGFLPPISDTEPKKIQSSEYAKLFESPLYLYAVTSGEQGEAPVQTDKVFLESGYAIFRDDWLKKEEATYVLFSAAYHTKYHKHSDDLNLYIYSNGEIITEAGPNGYNYQDPYTEYAYSSFAHNTLVVNGQGLPRLDQQYNKVFLSDYHLSSEVSEVTGVNERFEGVKHIRNVKFEKEDKCITVRDHIISEQNNEYKILWHIAADIHVYVRDQMVELYRNEKKVAELEFQTSAPIRIRSIQGQTKPEVQGWFFPKMESKQQAPVLEVEVSGSDVRCTTEIRLASFKAEKEEKDIIKWETPFNSTNSVRYHFVPAEEQNLKNQLIICFTSITTPYKFVYNYINSLANIKANKLFILDDFGDQGSYYLGRNRNHSIETTVVSLIQYMMAKHQIPHKNVTAIGSSKGGFAALYYGIKYFFGHIVAGAPQSMLGNYLIRQANHQNIATYMAGGTEEGDCYYLNHVLFRLFDQPNEVSPCIHLYVGTADPHYKNHVLPLYEQLQEKHYDVTLDVEEDITHEGLKTYFPYYLKKTISGILNIPFDEVMGPIIKKLTISQSNQKMIVHCDATGKELEYAFYVHKDGQVLEKFFYTESPDFEYTLIEPGSYLCRVFVRDSKMQKTVKSTNVMMVENLE